MSYRSWERQNFLLPSRTARIWSDLCRRGRVIRAWWKKLQAYRYLPSKPECDVCSMNGSSLCCECQEAMRHFQNQPATSKGTP